MSEVDHPVLYFNNAAQARLSPSVREAGIAQINKTPWDLRSPDTDYVQQIRELYAQLIGTFSTNVSIAPSTAFAISMAAMNVERTLINMQQGEETGGRILVLQNQYDSAVYPWQDLCERHAGWTIQVVEYPEDSDDNNHNWTESVMRALQDEDSSKNPPIRVACLPPLHWSSGMLVNLEIIGAYCKQHNILLIVDGTQGIGAIPFDIKTIQPTLVACSVHKWLRGPHVASLVYIDPAFHDTWQPLDHHDRGRLGEGGWSVNKYAMPYPRQFLPDARKFDAGGHPNPYLLPMLAASLKEVVQLDPNQLQAELKRKMTPLIDWAKANGFQVGQEQQQAYHLIGIEPPGTTNNSSGGQAIVAMCKSLANRNVFVSPRGGRIRISAYIDTTNEEVQLLIAALQEVMLASS